VRWEADDQLVQWHGLLDGQRWNNGRDRKRGSVRFRLIEGLGTGGGTCYLKLADFVRKPVRGKRGRAIGHLKVQMGHDRIAGVAYQADHLAKVNFLSTVHLNAARLHVGVEGIAVTTEVENDAVAVSLIQRDVGGVATRCLLRLCVNDGDDESVSDR
jgi:hypothetical protein